MPEEKKKPTPRKRSRKSVKVNQAQAQKRKVERDEKRKIVQAKSAEAAQKAQRSVQSTAEAAVSAGRSLASSGSKVIQEQGASVARMMKEQSSNAAKAMKERKVKKVNAASNSRGLPGVSGFNLPSVQAPARNSFGSGRGSYGHVRLALSPVVLGVLGVVLFFALLIGIDAGLNWGKVFPGVRVANVELGGLTQEEAQVKLSEAYQGKIYQGKITIYAGEEQKEAVESGNQTDLGPEEQLSVEEVQKNTQKWDVTPADVGASIDYAGYAKSAYEVGRSDGSIFGRLNALIGGVDLPFDLTFDQDKVELLAQKIDKTIGDPRVDWNIQVEDGQASVTKGHDGYMVDRDELAKNIKTIILSTPTGTGDFVANAPYAPLRIDEEAANKTCEMVNNAIADGAVIACQTSSWTATNKDVGAWVATKVEEQGSGWKLSPYIDEDTSRSSILHNVKQSADKSGITVTFENTGEQVLVNIAGEGTMPLIPQAAKDLTTALFGSDEGSAQEGAKAADGNPVSIEVGIGPIPSSMTFDEALESGVIEEISSFTTEYNTGEGTEARVNNIHVAADELNNSICPANGGSWSFNNVAGESTEEKGFQAAGSILDGEYVDSIGGGVCQVATTVFNAVYNAGYPVPNRHNHSLYIAAYPEGRDAAVSYPDLDLEWTNNTTSDVIMRTSYTDSSVTVALYGISPNLTVETEVGEWREGRAYKTVTKEDPDLPSGTTELYTSGTNGSIITVVRKVKDSAGNLVSEDEFTSEYEPKDEVTLVGTA